MLLGDACHICPSKVSFLHCFLTLVDFFDACIADQVGAPGLLNINTTYKPLHKSIAIPKDLMVLVVWLLE